MTHGKLTDYVEHLKDDLEREEFLDTLEIELVQKEYTYLKKNALKKFEKLDPKIQTFFEEILGDIPFTNVDDLDHYFIKGHARFRCLDRYKGIMTGSSFGEAV